MTIRKKREMKSILNFFKNNLKTLIMAVIFAVIIWFAVSIQVFPDEYDHVDGIAVTAEPTSYMQQENLRIIDFQQDISIQIMGKRYVIGTLTPEDFSASLDLSEITSPGKHIVNVNVNMLKPNDDYRIMTTNLTASIEVERIISKEINIEVNTNSLNVGNELQIQTDDIVLSSSTVVISGEQSLVNSVARAVIEPAFDGVLTETTRLSGTLALYSSDNTRIQTNELEYQADNYTVTIPVYRVRTLPLNISFKFPQNMSTGSIKYSLYPQEITIAAPAGDISIENLDVISVGEIDLTDVSPRMLQGGIKLPISLPDGYKNLSGVGIAHVSFEEIDSYGVLEFPISTENFTILNGDPSYDYTFVTSQIDVTAIGPSEIIKNLSSDDILGTVNLLGIQMDPGVRNITVTVRVSGQYRTAWITGDYKVDIRVSEKLPETETQE